jgi:hypothetical protein
MTASLVSGMKLLVSQLTIFMKSINTNLSTSQKELLLWHERLSHAMVKWVQKLMRDRKWLPGTADNKTTLHSGPFIPTEKGSHAQISNTSTLKCAACLYEKPPQDLLNILLRDLHQRNKFSNRIISSLVIAYQLTIIFLPSLVESHTHLARNKAVIHLVAYLLITQVIRFSTFPSIQPLLLRLSKVHFDWKRWLWKKESGSRHITPTMESSLQQNSKITACNKIKNTCLVALGQNTRTELQKEILKRLRNEHTPTCFTLQPIGSNMPVE